MSDIQENNDYYFFDPYFPQELLISPLNSNFTKLKLLDLLNCELQASAHQLNFNKKLKFFKNREEEIEWTVGRASRLASILQYIGHVSIFYLDEPIEAVTKQGYISRFNVDNIYIVTQTALKKLRQKYLKASLKEGYSLDNLVDTYCYYDIEKY